MIYSNSNSAEWMFVSHALQQQVTGYYSQALMCMLKGHNSYDFM